MRLVKFELASKNAQILYNIIKKKLSHCHLKS